MNISGIYAGECEKTKSGFSPHKKAKCEAKAVVLFFLTPAKCRR
jgi:hypothetical protein